MPSSGPPDDDLVELWERVERELRAADALVEIDREAQRLFDEFLDHNELGLAFETLLGALADGATAPRPDVLAHLEAAATAMGLHDDPGWRRLTRRA